MTLQHKVILLKSGVKIRFILVDCKYIEFYQYTVDILFPNNNWQRVFVSKLFQDKFRFILTVCKAMKCSCQFNTTFLSDLAREKYGHEMIFN